MKLICSHGHKVRWKQKKCRKCGELLGVIPYLKRKVKRIFSGPLVYCTNCWSAFPVGYKECPYCTQQNTLANALESVCSPVREKVLTADLHTRRKVQRLYLVLSAVGLFAVVRHMTSLEVGDWCRIGFISVLYMASLGLLIKWFVRREIMIKFLLLTNWVVKVGLLFNYLSCLLLLQMAVAEWWAQFMAVGALVAITYVGAFVFCSLFWPMAGNIKNIFFGEEPTDNFNSMNPQGRQGRYDNGRGGNL